VLALDQVEELLRHGLRHLVLRPPVMERRQLTAHQLLAEVYGWFTDGSPKALTPLTSRKPGHYWIR
jgi:hypothetical protein